MEHTPEHDAITKHADAAIASVDALLGTWGVDHPVDVYVRDHMLAELARVADRVQHALRNLPLT